MNLRIAKAASLLNAACVAGFALSLLFESTLACYLTAMGIALSFVPMACAFRLQARPDARLAGFTAAAFAGVYAAVILLVYFAQVTTVRQGGLSAQAAALLDFQQFGLLFHYDLMGYGLMALSTFFAGLTVLPGNREERWLRGLLLAHGGFALPCFVVPMLNLFASGQPLSTGTALLLLWCLYFMPVGVLAFRFFSHHTALSGPGTHP